jgi:hypothetical protein
MRDLAQQGLLPGAQAMLLVQATHHTVCRSGIPLKLERMDPEDEAIHKQFPEVVPVSELEERFEPPAHGLNVSLIKSLLRKKVPSLGFPQKKPGVSALFNQFVETFLCSFFPGLYVQSEFTQIQVELEEMRSVVPKKFPGFPDIIPGFLRVPLFAFHLHQVHIGECFPLRDVEFPGQFCGFQKMGLCPGKMACGKVQGAEGVQIGQDLPPMAFATEPFQKIAQDLFSLFVLSHTLELMGHVASDQIPQGMPFARVTIHPGEGFLEIPECPEGTSPVSLQ